MKIVGAALAAAAHRLGADPASLAGGGDRTVAGASGARDRVLARLGGPSGQAARAAAAALDGAAALEDASRRQRAEWAARARAPVPAGMRGVHPTWIEAALAELPPTARDAIAGAAGAADDAVQPTNVWLARWATAGFPPLDPVRPGPPRTPADLAQLGAAEANRWLGDIGLEQLAHALDGPWADKASFALGPLFEEAQARVARRPAGALGPRRAALERCAGLVPFGADDRVVIGARTVAPFVAGPIRAALALRMPKPLGERVLAALVDFARAAPSRGPAWSVLVLP